MPDDPLSEIEQAQGQRNIGNVIFRIYQGARDEGASLFEAFLMVVAWVRGTTGANDDKPEEEDEGK